MNPFIAQTKAESLRLIRSPFFLLFSMLMPLAFYAMFTLLNGADTQIGEVSWASYSLMSMTAFSLIGTAVGQFGIRISYERKSGLLRLLKVTPLSSSAWVGAKLVSHIIIHVLIIAVMFAVSAVAFGTQMPLGRWLACAAWLLLGSLPFLGLGILIGMIKNTDVATAVSNLIYMGISVLGGLWMPLSNFPSWLQTVGEWMPSHAFASVAWSLLSGEINIAADMLLLAGYGVLFLSAAILLLNKRGA